MKTVTITVSFVCEIPNGYAAYIPELKISIPEKSSIEIHAPEGQWEGKYECTPGKVIDYETVEVLDHDTM